jgi:AbrB family looped-hinge helix DNA binding protein
MDIGVTKVSSRGQVVLPLDMREGINEGDKFLVFRENDSFILKKADSLSKQFLEDLEFARRADAALDRYERNSGKAMTIDEFKSRKWQKSSSMKNS